MTPEQLSALSSEALDFLTERPRHERFAEECSQQALAGADGRRAAELLAGAKDETTGVFADACEEAVRRLLASPDPLAEGHLFTDDELDRIAESLARGIATADLMGRTRVRRRAEHADRLSVATETFAEPSPELVKAVAEQWFHPDGSPKTRGMTQQIIGKVMEEHGLPLREAAALFEKALLFHKNEHVVGGKEAYWELVGRMEQGRGYDRFAEDHDPFDVFADPIPSLAPQSALDYFRRLVPTLGGAATRYGPRLDRHAFTLAVASDQVILDRVKTAILKALTDGTEGTPEVQDVLDSAGVSHRNPQYAELVVRTNVIDAYNQGAQDELAEPEMREQFPAWEYLGVLDGRTGDDHRPKIGRYYPSSAPFAEVRGPRVFNCRCSFAPVHRSMMSGVRIEGSW